jgi:hypothetical protein
MAVNQEGREFLSGLVRLVDVKESVNMRADGMKTTNVAGYPIFMMWAAWGGTELAKSGITKAFLLQSYLQRGEMPLNKITGASAIENPLDMIATEMPTPYNCKLSVTPTLDISRLKVNEYYAFVIALRPAAMIGETGGRKNGQATPYWDGWIKSVGNDPSEVYKDLIDQYFLTKNQWQQFKAQKNGVNDFEPTKLPLPPKPPDSSNG